MSSHFSTATLQLSAKIVSSQRSKKKNCTKRVLKCAKMIKSTY